jgi:GntR family transcriptional regulator
MPAPVSASRLNGSEQGIPWQALLGSRSMRIDPASAEHPYRQLAAQLRERIERGEITRQLPSITDLTAQTGLAVGTVRRGIDLLVKEGMVQTVPGRGSFVR